MTACWSRGWLERAGAPIAWEDAHWAVFFGGEGEKSIKSAFVKDVHT